MEVPQLPLPFQVWLNWMLAEIILAPILFIRHRQGRIALLGSVVMVASAITSLVFDVRDFGRWILGDRGVVNPPPWSETQMPWVMLILIAAALGYAGHYVFGKRTVPA